MDYSIATGELTQLRRCQL